MNRSRLRNQFLKNRSVESKMKYNKQRNICVVLLRKTKIFANIAASLGIKFEKLPSNNNDSN